MKYAAVYQARLCEPPFSDAPMDALGVWVRLAAAAATAETDTLALTQKSSLRTLILCAGVSQSDVACAVKAGLCRWTETGLFVEGYDYHGQRVVESRRLNGGRGGRPKRADRASIGSTETRMISSQKNHSVLAVEGPVTDRFLINPDQGQICSPIDENRSTRKSRMISPDKNHSVNRIETEAKPLSLPLPSLPSLSDPIGDHDRPAETNPKPDPGTTLLGDLEIAGKQVARAAPPAYPVAFEAVWAGTGKQGSKFEAFKKWKQVGSPAWGDIAAVWSAYMLSDGPAGGFIKHLSTWFSQRCHQQEWLPSRRHARAAANGRANGVGHSPVTAGVMQYANGRIEP